MPEVEQTEVEETTEQESPTAKQQPSDAEVTDTAGKPDKTPDMEADESQAQSEQERNWRALREELKQKEAELEKLKGGRKPSKANVKDSKKSEVVSPWLSQQDNVSLELDEFKAQQAYPELDNDSDQYDPLFERAVAGEYRAALDEYAQSKLTGDVAELPSATKIARELKSEWEERFGKVSAQAKQEGAKAAKKSVSQKEATVEAEGRSDQRQNIADDQNELVDRSRHGDDTAIAERLSRSEL